MKLEVLALQAAYSIANDDPQPISLAEFRAALELGYIDLTPLGLRHHNNAVLRSIAHRMPEPHSISEVGEA